MRIAFRPWFVIGTLILLAIAAPAEAQNYPLRAITLVVPFPPAGPTDIAGRLLAEKLSLALGQPVVVDNRSGANGNIGVQLVARSAPDGYTLLLGTGGTHGVNPSLYKNAGYDPIRDFAPISWLISTPNVILVNPNVPAKNVTELIALAKATPNSLSIAVPGLGSTPHMASELFKRAAGADFTTVPYRGSAPAMTDLMAGTVQVMFDGISTSLAQVKSGKLRALAVTGAKRSETLPDVPTVMETIPEFEVSAWFGVYAPAGTPAPVVAQLNREIDRILQMPDVRRRFAEFGSEPVGGPPEKLRDQVQREVTRWSALIKANHIVVE